MTLLEVACFSPESAVLACEAGADRIELCDDREVGGTTPPLTWLTTIKRQITIPIFVMIRPRGGDFHYTSKEFNTMRAEIHGLKPHADGFVFGILDKERKVDVSRTAALVEMAKPLPCTFHKAFDEAPDVFEALEDVFTTGCQNILTSGGASSAYAGIETLGQLVRMSRGRVTIMPGGSVRASDIAILRGYTRASILHSSGVLKGESGPSAEEVRSMKTLLAEESVGLPPYAKPPSPTGAQSSEDDASAPDMLMCAVSTGTTPRDHDRHGF